MTAVVTVIETEAVIAEGLAHLVTGIPEHLVAKAT